MQIYPIAVCALANTGLTQMVAPNSTFFGGTPFVANQMLCVPKVWPCTHPNSWQTASMNWHSATWRVTVRMTSIQLRDSSPAVNKPEWSTPVITIQQNTIIMGWLTYYNQYYNHIVDNQPSNNMGAVVRIPDYVVWSLDQGYQVFDRNMDHWITVKIWYGAYLRGKDNGDKALSHWEILLDKGDQEWSKSCCQWQLNGW